MRSVNLGCLFRMGMALPQPEVTSRQLLQGRNMALCRDVSLPVGICRTDRVGQEKSARV